MGQPGHVLVKLLDDPAVQSGACFVAQRLARDVAHLREVVDEQVDGLREERREQVVRVAQHAAVVGDDRWRDDPCERGGVMSVPRTGGAERGQEQREVLPCRLPVLRGGV